MYHICACCVNISLYMFLFYFYRLYRKQADHPSPLVLQSTDPSEPSFLLYKRENTLLLRSQSGHISSFQI